MAIAVKRALSLLELFTESLPEIGLSDAARLSGHDKATVHRLLNTLREADLVEQDSRTKLYRIGPGVLRLARVRERSSPLVSVVQPLLDRLSAATGETSHFSLYIGNALVVVATTTSTRPTHVAMNKLETLPFHATASGLAFLAFCPPEISADILKPPLASHTPWTVTDPKALRQSFASIRDEGFGIADRTYGGFGIADRTYDEDVYGIAIPVFNPTGTVAIGAIAVVAPRHRMTEAAIAQVKAELRSAGVELQRATGKA